MFKIIKVKLKNEICIQKKKNPPKQHQNSQFHIDFNKINISTPSYHHLYIYI